VGDLRHHMRRHDLIGTARQEQDWQPQLRDELRHATLDHAIRCLGQIQASQASSLRTSSLCHLLFIRRRKRDRIGDKCDTRSSMLAAEGRSTRPKAIHAGQGAHAAEHTTSPYTILTTMHTTYSTRSPAHTHAQAHRHTSPLPSTHPPASPTACN
jgi:hypothetical protein